MSEERVPDAVFLKRLPRISGNKSVKIELFRIGQFESAWSLEQRQDFCPMVPLQMGACKQYWAAEMYRVRMNGVWQRGITRYVFFTWQEIMEDYMRVEI